MSDEQRMRDEAAQANWGMLARREDSMRAFQKPTHSMLGVPMWLHSDGKIRNRPEGWTTGCDDVSTTAPR